MEKSKTVAYKDLSIGERLFANDLFIAEEMTKHIDRAWREFVKSKGHMLGADYSPKTRVDSDRK